MTRVSTPKPAKETIDKDKVTIDRAKQWCSDARKIVGKRLVKESKKIKSCNQEIASSLDKLHDKFGSALPVAVQQQEERYKDLAIELKLLAQEHEQLELTLENAKKQQGTNVPLFRDKKKRAQWERAVQEAESARDQKRGQPFDQFARYLDELAFAAEREAGRVKGEIAEAEETRKLARGMYTKTIGSADEAVAALTQAEKALGAPSGRTPDELLTFCSGPPATSLLTALKSAGTQTGALAEPVVPLEQTLKLTQRKADKGQQLATGGDNAAAGKLIEEAIQTLAGELTATSQRAAELKQQATDALAALGA